MATEPTAPDQVRPLLIGSALPDVEITNLDGESAPLADVVLGSPTLLVFYRGGW
jgi:peroxiredoxin